MTQSLVQGIIEWWFIKVANGPLGFLFGRMRKEER